MSDSQFPELAAAAHEVAVALDEEIETSCTIAETQLRRRNYGLAEQSLQRAMVARRRREELDEKRRAYAQAERLRRYLDEQR